jgi:hypothetical protein
MTTLLFLVTLLFAAPAWAVDYSGTTTIDLTTLAFSGVTTSYAPVRQKTFPYVKSAATEQLQRAQDFGAVVTRNLTATLAGTGDATATNDATHLVAGAHMTGSNGAYGMVEQAGELTATQTGTLTVTVHYTIAHTLSSGSLPSNAIGGPTLLLVDQYASGQRSSLTAGTEAGTLSVTRSVTQGQRLWLSVGAAEIAGGGGNAPGTNRRGLLDRIRKRLGAAFVRGAGCDRATPIEPVPNVSRVPPKAKEAERACLT